jgi:hypothetical protein
VSREPAPTSVERFQAEVQARRRVPRAVWLALGTLLLLVVYGAGNAASQRLAVQARMERHRELANDFLGSTLAISDGQRIDSYEAIRSDIRRADVVLVKGPMWTLLGDCVTVEVHRARSAGRVFLRVEREGWFGWAVVDFATRGECW